MPYILKVVIAGEGGVGKTALTVRFCKGVFLEGTKMTIGVDFSAVKVTLGQDEVTLQLWDFGGESRFRFILPGYCRGAAGALLVFDTTQKYTFESLPEWLTLLRDNTKSDKGNVPIVLVGTKMDLDGRQIQKEEAEEWAKANNLTGYVECSSKTGEQVGYVFGMVTQSMLATRKG